MAELTFNHEELDALADRLARLVLEHLDRLGQIPRYMAIEEAAGYLCLPEGQLRKLVQARKIPHLRPGRRIIFDRGELDEWIGNHGVSVRMSPPE